MTIPEIIKNLSGRNTFNDITIYEAVVTKFNADTRTVVCTSSGGIEIADIEVSVMTTIGDGVYYIPKIDSTVYIMLTPLLNPFIVQYGEIESIVLSCSETITMNSDEFGGLVKVQELTDKINTLENALNNLITLYNAHVHPVVGASTGPTVSTDTDVIQITTVEDLENPDIVHGEKITE